MLTYAHLLGQRPFTLGFLKKIKGNVAIIQNFVAGLEIFRTFETTLAMNDKAMINYYFLKPWTWKNFFWIWSI